MSLTNVALLGILLGFMFLAVGFLMDSPVSEATTYLGKFKRPSRRSKKRAGRLESPRRSAA
jgi:hypothetical protein